MQKVALRPRADSGSLYATGDHPRQRARRINDVITKIPPLNGVIRLEGPSGIANDRSLPIAQKTVLNLPVIVGHIISPMNDLIVWLFQFHAAVLRFSFMYCGLHVQFPGKVPLKEPANRA